MSDVFFVLITLVAFALLALLAAGLDRFLSDSRPGPRPAESRPVVEGERR